MANVKARGDGLGSASIKIEHLTKHFGNVQAVNDLDFEVAAGRVTGFLGPNGAGKTTTLRILLGLVRPSSGTATIDGKRYCDLEHPTRQVGAVLEASSIHPGRTARDHLRVRALAGHLDRSRIDAVLKTVELNEVADRRVGSFSLGMKQRLNLAAALLGEPEILILDEPSNGLDPEGIRWLRDFLKDQSNQGKTVLVSSHILAEVAHIADDIVLLSHGCLVAKASLPELLKKAGTTDLEQAFFRLTGAPKTSEATK